MRRIIAEGALWAAATAASVSATAEWRRVRREISVRTMQAPISPSSRAVALTPAESLARAVDAIRDGNIFRRDRRVAEDAPAPTSPPSAMGMRPPRPPLVLRGLVGGPPWDAVLEGIPGREGTVVVRVGDSLNGFTVRAVRGDTVFVRSQDTTWKLTLRRM